MASSRGAPIATLKTIEAALKLVDTKKQSLKRAYDDLQAHSSLLSSFSLSWSDLDSHFSSLQTSLTRRFHRLQSLESSSSPQSHDPLDSIESTPVHGGGRPYSSSSSFLVTGCSQVEASASVQDPSPSNPLSESQTPTEEVPLLDLSLYSLNASTIYNRPARPELVVLCEKMDGQGLRNYCSEHSKEREAIRTELVSLMRVAPDAGALVLDAMEGFYASNSMFKGDKDMDLNRLRKSCLDLLEVLTVTKPNLSHQVRERAKILALEWKQKVNLNGDSLLEALGFLSLLVAYELRNEFDVNELLNYFVVVAPRFKQATALCRAIGLGDKITDLVQKLIENGEQLLAVKFIFEFGLTQKFQPVPLLKDHLKESKKFPKKIWKDGKNSFMGENEARSREINALKSILKIVDEHKLDSEYPRQELEKQIEMLEKQKADKKVAASAPDNKSQQQSKKQQQQSKKQQAKKHRPNGNKRPRMSAMTGPATVPGSVAGSSSTVPSFQQSHLPPAGLLPAAGPYGLMGSTPIPSYAGASAGPYSLAGAAMGFTGNPGPAGVHPYSEPYMSSGYYGRPAAYGGYGFRPQYHPGYYPQ